MTERDAVPVAAGGEGQGWGFPLNSRKAHYWRAGEIISLCGKWMYSGRLSDDQHDSPDNCKDCARRRGARKAAADGND